MKKIKKTKFAGEWMDIEKIVLSELAKTQNSKCCIRFLCHLHF